MSDKLEITIVEGNKLYKCQKCNEMSKRRYNVERHYRRFHEQIIPHKKCCGTTFDTKSDFYEHREKAHDEKKKYPKGNQKNDKFFEVQQQEAIIEILEFSNTQKYNIPLELRETNFVSAPKKFIQYKWQNSFENRVPLVNINSNISRRTLNKRASQVKSRNSVHPKRSKKENVKIYNITDRSKEGIDKGLYSIKF